MLDAEADDDDAVPISDGRRRGLLQVDAPLHSDVSIHFARRKSLMRVLCWSSSLRDSLC